MILFLNKCRSGGFFPPFLSQTRVCHLFSEVDLVSGEWESVRSFLPAVFFLGGKNTFYPHQRQNSSPSPCCKHLCLLWALALLGQSSKTKCHPKWPALPCCTIIPSTIRKYTHTALDICTELRSVCTQFVYLHEFLLYVSMPLRLRNESLSLEQGSEGAAWNWMPACVDMTWRWIHCGVLFVSKMSRLWEKKSTCVSWLWFLCQTIDKVLPFDVSQICHDVGP